MHLSVLPLPLSCTVNTASTPIIEIGESVFKKNIRLRTKIGISPLTLSGITVQLDTGFSGNPSSN